MDIDDIKNNNDNNNNKYDVYLIWLSFKIARVRLVEGIIYLYVFLWTEFISESSRLPNFMPWLFQTEIDSWLCSDYVIETETNVKSLISIIISKKPSFMICNKSVFEKTNNPYFLSLEYLNTMDSIL